MMSDPVDYLELAKAVTRFQHPTLEAMNWNDQMLPRFISKYEPVTESGCWIWMAASTVDGYGIFTINRKLIYAHRFSYEFFVGPIPLKMFVCHQCDVPSCVNPSHLFLGTNGDNVRDSVRKGRNHNHSKTHCKRGHELTGDNVRHLTSGSRLCRECQVLAWIIRRECMN
jgi:hypothetical protein